MQVYQRGYEKGLKSVKKDLLVLKFVNKTKTNLLRKYTERMENANKIVDAADIRPALKLYLSQNYGKTTTLPSDGLYLKNQLKYLADQDSLLNTAELCDFFLKVINTRENEKNHELKKTEDNVKRLQGRQTVLTSTMEKYRNNVNSLPVLINSIIEDFIVQNERDKSQEHSINRSLSDRSARSKDVFLTAGKQDDKKLEDFFVHDFTTELYGQLDDDQRKDLLMKLISNKLLLFNFREFLLTKLEPHDTSGPSLIRGARARLTSSKVKDLNKSQQSESEQSHSRSRTLNELIPSKRSLSHSRTGSGLPQVVRRDASREPTANSTKLNLTADSISLRKDAGLRVVRESAEIAMDMIGGGKRKILRYMVKKSGQPVLE